MTSDLIHLFKDDILKEVGPEAFELGLLIAIETDPHEEEAHVFTFRHLLLLEFVAAKYTTTLTTVIITLDNVSLVFKTSCLFCLLPISLPVYKAFFTK